MYRCKYDTVIELLRSHPRPVTLTFRKAEFDTATYSEYVLTHRGSALEGISLGRYGRTKNSQIILAVLTPR